MLYDDMQRSKAGQRPQYILFSPPERIESQKDRPRTVAMKAMRSAGCTLQQIGETFGITAERVRQLLHGKPRPLPPKPDEGPRRQLAKAMKRWLREAGYRKCSDCGLWKPDNSWSRCMDCNRRRARKYYETHREHCLAFAAAKRLRDKNYQIRSAGRTQDNAQQS
jgi:hypothetical protein